MKCIFLFTILIAVNCSRNGNTNGQYENESESVNVKVTVIKPQRFSESGIYFGMIEAAQTANLVCYSGGRVDHIDVSEGQYVKKGASLAKIDYEKAQAVLLTAKAQHTIAQSTLEQTKRHFNMGNASQLAVDQQHLVFLNAHDAYVDASKNYRGCFAIAPVSGIVTKRYIEQFQEILPNTRTFSVERLDSIKIRIGITESDIYNVKVGSEAILTVPMITDQKWHGCVKNLARAAGELDRVFSAELYFENKDYLLKPGISGRVQLILETFDHAIVLPSDIIISEGIEQAVIVVDSNCIAHRRFIETGPQSETTTMVTGGLAFGDLVISDGFHMVREGSLVKIENTVTTND